MCYISNQMVYPMSGRNPAQTNLVMINGVDTLKMRGIVKESLSQNASSRDRTPKGQNQVGSLLGQSNGHDRLPKSMYRSPSRMVLNLLIAYHVTRAPMVHQKFRTILLEFKHLHWIMKIRKEKNSKISKVCFLKGTQETYSAEFLFDAAV